MAKEKSMRTGERSSILALTGTLGGRVAAGRVRTRGSSVFTRSWHGAGPFFENGPVCRGGAVPYFQTDPRGGSIFVDPPRSGYYPEDPRVLYIITRSKNGSLLWVLV